MGVLRRHRATLMAVVGVLLRDPIATWHIADARKTISQLQTQPGKHAFTVVVQRINF